MRGHGGRRDVNRRGRGQQSAVRLFCEFAVGAFDVAVGECVVGDAIDADGPSGCDRGALGNTGAAGKHQDPVGGSVESFVRPSLGPLLRRLVVVVSHISLLDDGRNPALRKKRGVQRLTGADALRQPRLLIDDLGIGRAVDRTQTA